MKLLAALALSLLFFAAPGHAQAPPGLPYTSVQYTSTDPVDKLRADLFDRLELLDRQQRQLIDERDRQYAQRFDAQQEAVQAALQAAKEAVANALSAAKEAVLKAEDASNKRFEGVNEFRQALNDLSRLQMPRQEAEAIFETMNEKISNITSRLDNIKSTGQGATETWALIGAGMLFLLAIGTFVLNARRDQRAVK